MVTTKPVAGYLRVSQARDGMRAPQLYAEEITRYCSYKQLVLCEIFEDIDHSAYRGARPRPCLEELIERRREFSGVVIPKLSRFGRSVSELTRLFDIFEADRISLIFLDMNVDSSTSHGRLLRHIMSAFAEFESDVKSDYAKANHRQVALQGRPWGGRAPFGYERHPTERSYVVVAERAEVIRYIFTHYAQGESQYRIATDLAGMKAHHPDLPWPSQRIGRVLDNPAYAALCLVDDTYIHPLQTRRGRLDGGWQAR